MTPKKCGLYETTRELVAAERKAGIDARMFDPAPTPYYVAEDRGAICCDKKWLEEEADVIIDHSGCDGTTDKLQTPHILVAHGRPRHSFLSEVNGGPPIYSYHYRLEREPKYKAAVTFWPEHIDYLRAFFVQTPVYHVPACVDLEAWTPDGPSGYGFHGKQGRYNVVLADTWRDDSDPFEALHALILAARERAGLKVHIYGRQTKDERGWGALFKTLQEMDALGEVTGWIDGLANVYRAADCLVSTNRIATRAVREAMACGCPVVNVGSIRQTMNQVVQILDGGNVVYRVRETAEKVFDPKESAASMIGIAEGVA